MIQSNWYVITGAPSSGKTTLIEHLSAQQFHVAPEIARDYMQQLLANHQSKEYIQMNAKQVQRAILARALKREHMLAKDQLIFFDRGTTDSIGYFNYHQLDIQQVLRFCRHIRYKKIFFCHPLPVVSDMVRTETNADAQKIGALIYQAYLDMGYTLIELPAIGIEKRLNIILSHIN